MTCEYFNEEFFNIDDWLCHTLLKHSELEINGPDVPESTDNQYERNHVMFNKIFYTLRHYKDREIGR